MTAITATERVRQEDPKAERATYKIKRTTDVMQHSLGSIQRM